MNAVKEFFSDIISNWPSWVVIGIVVFVAGYFLSGPVMGSYKFHSKDAHSFQEIALLCQKEDVPDGILTRLAEVKLPDEELCPTVFWDFEKDFKKAERFNGRYRHDYHEGKTRIEVTENKSKELAKLASVAVDKNDGYLFRPEKWGVRYHTSVTPGCRYIEVSKVRTTWEGFSTTDEWFIRWSGK